MEKKRSFRALYHAVIAVVICGCQWNNTDEINPHTGLSLKTESKIGASLGQWKSLSYDHEGLYSQLSHLPVGLNETVMLPDPTGKPTLLVNLRRNRVISNNVILVTDNSSRYSDSDGFGIRTYAGETRDGKAVSLTISRELLSIVLFQDDHVTRMVSARQYNWDAPDRLIVFRDSLLQPDWMDELSVKIGYGTQSAASTGFEERQQVLPRKKVFSVTGSGDPAYYHHSQNSQQIANFLMVSATNEAQASLPVAELQLASLNLDQGHSGMKFPDETAVLASANTDHWAINNDTREVQLYFTGNDHVE